MHSLALRAGIVGSIPLSKMRARRAEVTDEASNIIVINIIVFMRF